MRKKERRGEVGPRVRGALRRAPQAGRSLLWAKEPNRRYRNTLFLQRIANSELFKSNTSTGQAGTARHSARELEKGNLTPDGVAETAEGFGGKRDSRTITNSACQIKLLTPHFRENQW